MVDELLGLDVRIDAVEVERNEFQVVPEWSRVTTTVVLRGGGHEGRGEDVTYQGELHDDFPLAPVQGRWTIDALSRSLDGFPFFGDSPQDHAALDYRRWAWESAALDLALAQNGTTLAAVLGRIPQPVTYVVSTRVANVPKLLELHPWLRFKLDPARDWSEETIDDLAARGVVDTADFKGVYRGDFGNPPDPELYARIAEAFPDAWLEDPGLSPETDEVLRPHRDRVTWDAPIHSVDDVLSLPFAPKCLNVKPSRFGTVRRLFAFYAWCEENGVRMYGGGQFELGVGRVQIQHLASLFHPDLPNDVAPSAFNAVEPPRDVPRSPLEPPHAFGTKP